MKLLEFKWTVSRGRNTYGYNICSLYENGYKQTSCNGGGYDMQGTCLGNWITKNYSKELLKLTIPFYGLSYHNPNFDPGKIIIEGKTIEQRENDGDSLGLERYQAFYHASSPIPTELHVIPIINGACGLDQVRTILKAIGYKLTHMKETSNCSTYILEDIS